MSEITKQELTDILDAREEKTLTTIRLILENSIEKISSDFKLAMMKMDNTVAKEIADNKKNIERLEHDCELCKKSLDKETDDQEGRLRKLERWFWGASGVIAVAVVVIGVLK